MLALTVDGVKAGYLTVQNSKGTFQGPITFTWEYGSTHTYSWESVVLFGNSKRYSFESANGLAGSQSGTITASSSGTITANYKDEVLLSVTIRDNSGYECSSCGTVSAQAGWYPSGSTVQLQSVPFEGYTFVKTAIASTYVGVQGPQPIASISTENSKTITMDTAKTVNVYFQLEPKQTPVQTQTTTPTPTQKPVQTKTTTPAPTATNVQKPTPQPTKYLLYENKQYGFSMKYPSNWVKQEGLGKNPLINSINIVNFAPSETSSIQLSFRPDDTIYKGLSDQKFLDKMQEEVKNTCSEISKSGVACSNWKVIEANRYTHANGYTMYVIGSTLTLSSDKNSLNVFSVSSMIPDGNDLWLTDVAIWSPDPEKIIQEISSATSTFTIYDYEGIMQAQKQTPTPAQKQTPVSVVESIFSLNVKASQKDNIVQVTIQNPKDSSYNIYGVKFTTVNGKITNYLKLNGWNYKRISDNAVIYQVKSSPLEPADSFTIKLKVDTKKTEIKWDAFTKDQKNLGTGKVKT